MKYFLILCLSTSSFIFSQKMYKPSQSEINNLPLWCQKMYGENQNLVEIDSLYKNYFASNEFVKSYHTQYYKRFRRLILNQLNENGDVVLISDEEANSIKKAYLKKQSNNKTTSWSLVGPIYNVQSGNQQGSGQTNVYAIDQCAGNMNVLYCGTEPGEVYKSIDGGNNWTSTSMNYDFGSGVNAVEVNPNDENIVLIGSNKGIYLSINGGQTWTQTLSNGNLGVNEILINSTDLQLIHAATDNGLYRSTDGGNTWNQIFTSKTYDVKENTANSTIIYCLKNNPSVIRCEFLISTDSGVTWNVQNAGWYNSTDAARTDGGGRIAVTLADPNRVYVHLIGEAKANDYGFIGVYKSIDGGQNWTLPNSPTGGPYTDTHPNLAIGSPDWTYHQGFYNCAIICSQTNANEVIVGGLNIWKSTDGASTFSGVSGYIGGPLNLHVDNQDFRFINGNYWFTTDGGIYKATDFLTTQPDFKMNGVNGSDFWGFGSGWNEDVLVGGLYHNGNLAYHENYGAGTFLELGGGEAPTGYVNPGNNKKTYFSDISGKILPTTVADPIQSFGFGMSPNETYFAAESSEMEFHPNCYNIAFIGKENSLWKTSDGGSSFNLVKEFGTNVNEQVKYIEISSSNPDVIYLNQQLESGNIGKLWKSIDAGQTWNLLTIPAGNSRRIVLTLNPINENEIWLAYPSGNNGTKVFHSADGGNSWQNITSSILNNESIQSIVHIAGTDGGIYVGTEKAVYYKNNTNSWQIDNSGLPTFTSVNILRPFYRDSKIRIATYGKGIWEGNLFENPSLPIARITVDNLKKEVTCEIDSFYFEDYSFLNHQGATWEWTFPSGSPANSSLRNPAVLFSTSGNHLGILKITDANGNFDIDSVEVNLNFITPNTIVQEGFENEFLPLGWSQSADLNCANWNVSSDAGAFGNSSKSAIFNNFDNDSGGKNSQLSFNLNLLPLIDGELKFDVAYALYGGIYSDTLEVLYSLDCGNSFQSIYKKGGSDLSTAPDLQTFFTPTASQWRTDSIDVSNLPHENNVQFSFRNIGHYGNVIYLDNINLLNPLSVNEINKNTDIQVFPTILCSGEFVNIIPNSKESLHLKLIDSQGKLVKEIKNLSSNQLEIPSNLSSGTYILNIQSETKIWNKKISVK